MKFVVFNRLTDFRESEILCFCGGKDLFCPRVWHRAVWHMATKVWM